MQESCLTARCWFQIFALFNPIWDQCDSTPSTPMIGRDENGFRTSRLKQYPDGLAAGFAQTLVDQIGRSHRNGRTAACPEVTAELVKWLEDASAVTAQIREGAVWLRDYQGS